MPTTDNKQQKDAAKLTLRIIISDAYTFALSQELTHGIAAMNLENMMQQELARLQGPTNSTTYLPVLDRLKALKSTVEDALEKVKDIPPEEFQLSLDNVGVNTESDSGT